MVLVLCWGSADSRTHAAHYYVTSAAAAGSTTVPVHVSADLHPTTPEQLNQTCTPSVRTWTPVLRVSSDFSQSGWEVKQEESKSLKPGCGGEQRGVSPVDSSSTDGGDGGVDPRPEHGHSAPGAVRRTQNHHAVLRQLSSTGRTGHRERHWSTHNSSVNHRQEAK